MIPREVATSYDLIADRWNDGSFPQSNGIHQHERAIAFLTQKRNALDIGCGCSGRIIDLLLEQGFAAEGLDISGRMIRLARERHPVLIFHHADICEWEPQKSYDFISAWDSIWHVPLAAQEAVMRKIMHALAPGGIFIFTTGGLDAPSEKVDAAMGPKMYYSVLGIPRTLELLSECGCVSRHLEYDQYPQSHVFIIAQRVHA
ncbi:MAG: class I SAM-dependent methyltransferase [Gemmatimonadales bacterium]